MSVELQIALSDELVELIAERAAELVRQGVPRKDPPGRPNSGGWGSSPYLSVSEAADYLRAKPQRIYDLLSARRLTRHKDGKRVLVSRAELDAYLVPNGPSGIAPALPSTRKSGLPSGFAE
jgi:excisionase family DNA binding protein